MKLTVWFPKKVNHCCGVFWSSICSVLRDLNSFWIQLIYFAILSGLGYLALAMSRSRTSGGISDLDVFFTSVSASTVSSMSTVEMELFSNSQLLILTVLMLFGGEVFNSMLGLLITTYCTNNSDHIAGEKLEYDEVDSDLEIGNKYSSSDTSSTISINSIKCLGYVVMAYLLTTHFVGSSLIYMYFGLVSTRDVLENKGIHRLTFSVFATVSTFSNCGFIPTNENMMVFKTNPGLLLIMIPQILLGNTLFPTCLRLVIWVLARVTEKVEYSHMLQNSKKMKYGHLVSSLYSASLGVTVFGFIAVQFMLFCVMEWNSETMDGLSSYQKLVGALFQVVNSRHTGESVFDLSVVSPGILVLFGVMMYLPPYVLFLPNKGEKNNDSEDGKKNENKKKNLNECLLFSQLSYLVIFIIFICVTEREKLKADPLNFSVLNIVTEVLSAYGNVGFSTGYNCERRLNPNDYCENKTYGFVGRWSSNGRFILILVMVFGRLKKFNKKGGAHWKML